jgi:uncharacterized OB-fold protein
MYPRLFYCAAGCGNLLAVPHQTCAACQATAAAELPVRLRGTECFQRRRAPASSLCTECFDREVAELAGGSR